MDVHVRIPGPRTLLVIGTLGVLWWNGVISIRLPFGSTAASLGGAPASALISGAVQDINRERITQSVLARREEILRYQLHLLEQETMTTDDEETRQRLASTRTTLLAILKERAASESLLKQSLEQLWDAEGSAFALEGISTNTVILWPVSPRRGISAVFSDAAYEERFGFPHHAIDIPTPQGTPIQAPADGTVVRVVENGIGYSFIVLRHSGEVETIFGHVSESLVREGDHVSVGDDIALTGGTPGTKGAGTFTTGPHLHFAVRVRGALVDPLTLLPKL